MIDQQIKKRAKRLSLDPTCCIYSTHLLLAELGIVGQPTPCIDRLSKRSLSPLLKLVPIEGGWRGRIDYAGKRSAKFGKDSRLLLRSFRFISFMTSLILLCTVEIVSGV